MTYTFWQSGILIGESDFEERSDFPRHRGGIFRPTPYGVEIFPRLSGILSAGYALKTQLEADGLSPDDMHAEDVGDLLETTEAGRKVLDIGRTLTQVEVRGPDGQLVELASIAFIDTTELEALMRTMNLDGADTLTDLPADAPRYVVSATLSKDPPRSKKRQLGTPFPARHWSTDN